MSGHDAASGDSSTFDRAVSRSSSLGARISGDRSAARGKASVGANAGVDPASADRSRLPAPLRSSTYLRANAGLVPASADSNRAPTWFGVIALPPSRRWPAGHQRLDVLGKLLDDGGSTRTYTEGDGDMPRQKPTSGENRRGGSACPELDENGNRVNPSTGAPRIGPRPSPDSTTCLDEFGPTIHCRADTSPQGEQPHAKRVARQRHSRSSDVRQGARAPARAGPSGPREMPDVNGSVARTL